MKTYSRLKRATYLSSEPPAKKRSILDDAALSPSSDPALLRSDAACSPPRTSAPPQISSSTALPLSTPPSSPPHPSVQATAEPTSPLALPKRKTTFSFFARRAAATAAGPQPLAEQRNASNVRTKTASSAIQAAAPSDDKTRSKEKPPQRRLTQLQLDLGVAPVQRTCKTCGMAYVPSNAEDAALHKRFHAMNVGGVDVGKGFFARSVGKGGGGGEVIWEKGVDGDFVVVVGSRGKAAARTRVRRVLDVVERELGAVEIPDQELWGQTVVEEETGGKRARKEEDVRNSRSADSDTEAKLKPQEGAKPNGTDGNRTREVAVMRADRFKAYLYIRGSKCVGLCLTERITEAHRVVAVPEDVSNQSQTTTVASTKTLEYQTGSKDTTQLSTDASSDCLLTTKTTPTTPRMLTFSSTTHPADLGISRIWVSSSHRRHGIALALLDAAARDFCAYRCEEYDGGGDENDKLPPKERIAFSQPTDSGSRLARRWFGAETGWGVYT